MSTSLFDFGSKCPHMQIFGRGKRPRGICPHKHIRNSINEARMLATQHAAG